MLGVVLSGNLIQLVVFQRQEGLETFGPIGIRLAALLCGLTLSISFSLWYFFRTNKNLAHLLGHAPEQTPTSYRHDELPWRDTARRHDIRVDRYVNHNLVMRLTREVGHYPARLIRKVYRQHHVNALFIELFALILVLVLGHLIDFPFFRIPAACSVLLLFIIILMLVGAMSYWFRGWKVLGAIALLVMVDLLIGFGLLQYKNRPFGLAHSGEQAAYGHDALAELYQDGQVMQDLRNNEDILARWHARTELLFNF